MNPLKDFDALIKAFVKHYKTLTIKPIPDKAQKALKLIYENTEGLDLSQITTKTGSLKAPLIISFHPKLSLLNNNVHEALLCSLLAKELDMIPLWMPYVYDTGYKAKSKKISSSALFYFEGKYIQLRAPSQIRGNLIGMEPPLKDSEIKAFVSELKTQFTQSIQELKKYLDEINFGHELFNLKLKLLKMNVKEINGRISELEADFLKINKGTKTLAHSLTRFSVYLLDKLGIKVYPMMIDFLLPEIFGEILEDAVSRPSIAKDPEKLEGLFLWFDKKTKERTPIQFTGQSFIGVDENAQKVFEGGVKELVDALKNHDIIPTGPALMLLFNAIGCKITLGGTHTLEYYPEYIANSNKILQETDFDHTMQEFCYGNLKFIDSRNTGDILAVARILEKAGSRNIAETGSFKIPDAVVDHLNFLAGIDKVPLEYRGIAEALPKIKKPSIEKERERYEEITGYYNMKPEELKGKIKELKKFIPTIDVQNPPGEERLKMLVENYWEDINMRYLKMLQMIQLEQQFLGGSLPKSTKPGNEDDEGDDGEDDNIEVIYHGILKRSNRVPSLLELELFMNKITRDFIKEYELDFKTDNALVISVIKEKKAERLETMEFKEYKPLFEMLVPNRYLPDFLR
jgi:hypothetical protein